MLNPEDGVLRGLPDDVRCGFVRASLINQVLCMGALRALVDALAFARGNRGHINQVVYPSALIPNITPARCAGPKLPVIAGSC